MIKILLGNLLDSKAQTLVNTVNCVGVMILGRLSGTLGSWNSAREFSLVYPSLCIQLHRVFISLT